MDEVIIENTPAHLWQQFKQGDHQAFEAIVQQFYPKLLNYGLRWGLADIVVEDSLQDFFTDLWQKREGLGDVQYLNAYLVSSFRRRLFREKAKKDRLGGMAEVSDDYDFDVEFDVETRWIGEEQNNENAAQLKQHLDRLTKRQKEAIYLRFYQELDYSQIAQIMSINPHSAVNLVYDALKIMRRNWVVSLVTCLSLFFSKIF